MFLLWSLIYVSINLCQSRNLLAAEIFEAFFLLSYQDNYQKF